MIYKTNKYNKGMEIKKFQRNIENFTCEKCGAEVTGDGYTNHCPKCLWSKHVDVNPGDRRATCGGLMKPTSVDKDGPDYILKHACMTCGHTKPNKVSKEDDFDTIIAISKSEE